MPANVPKLRTDKAQLFEDLGYAPNAPLQKIHPSSASRRIVTAGVRFCKSLAAAMEALAAALHSA